MLEKPLAREDGKPERAVLVGLATREQPRDLLAEYLDGSSSSPDGPYETIRSFTQSLDHPDVRTFVGKGKLEEIATYIEENDIDLLIFDDEWSPSQLRNLGEALPETGCSTAPTSSTSSPSAPGRRTPKRRSNSRAVSAPALTRGRTCRSRRASA